MIDERALSDVARATLLDSLRVRRDEHYLFFTDSNSRFEDASERRVRRTFLHGLYEAFVEMGEELPLGRHDKYESTQKHGGEPGENIWKLALGPRIYDRLVQEDLFWKLKAEAALQADEERLLRELLERHASDIVTAVVAFPWFSVTHTKFTKLLKDTGCRMASMPMLTPSVLSGPMRADWGDVARVTRKVRELILRCDAIHVTCPRGTDLRVGVGEERLVHEDTGLLWKPGALGNLPAGEAYFVPRPRSTQGTVVITSGPDRPSVEPTRVRVDAGRVIQVEGDTEYGRFLETKFEQDYAMRNIAELGIGTNPLAVNVGSMIEGEKIQGTVHVALGDDQAMGGDTDATEHWDHVLSDVSVVGYGTEGEKIRFIETGRLLVD